MLVDPDWIELELDLEQLVIRGGTELGGVYVPLDAARFRSR